MNGQARSLAELIERLGDPVELAAGEILWHEGEPGRDVVAIADGELEITTRAGEDTVVLRCAGPGSLIGEIAALDGHPRSASVRAAGRCRVYRCTAESFRDLLLGQPEFLERLLREQVARVRSLTDAVSSSHQRAITDPLTGLYNVGFLQRRLALELDRAAQTNDPVSAIMIDVDHFKHFNDTHGHQAGNVVLETLADLLRACVRRGDIVARYGGEEFAVLLYGAAHGEGLTVARAVSQAVRSASIPGGDTQPLGRVTVSIGVATFPVDAPSAQTLLEAADTRLYAAKATGRDRVVGA